MCIYTYIQGGAVNRGLKLFFFQCIGLHVLLKLILGLKSTGWCGLNTWLTIYSILTSIFLSDGLTGWLTGRWKERHVLRIYTAANGCYFAATEGRRAAKLA
jgi:hypothetical protein